MKTLAKGAKVYVLVSCKDAKGFLAPAGRDKDDQAQICRRQATLNIARPLLKLPLRSAFPTPVKFEEFARNAQMPHSMRALAEKSVVQTRELCERSSKLY